MSNVIGIYVVDAILLLGAIVLCCWKPKDYNNQEELEKYTNHLSYNEIEE